MMKNFAYLVIVLSISCSSTGKESAEIEENGSISITGTVLNPSSDGIIKLEEIQNNQASEIAQISLKDDNTFEHQLEISQPGYYRLNFYGKQQVVMILHKDDVNVQVDGSSRQGKAVITGSRDHDIINELQQAKASLQQSDDFSRINAEFNEARNNGNQEKMADLQAEYQELSSNHQEMIAKKIKSYGPSLAVLEMLRSKIIDPDKFIDVYEHVAEEMNEAFPGLEYTQAFNETVEAMKKLAIGSTAPEIELPNPNGELVKLSSLRGNYVLLDFWAKWCGPCRRENPNVVRLYNKYNDDGFEVFGVSLDRNRQDWLQAIEEDNLTWTHVSDLKYWKSEAAKIYNVTAIPFALLLDPEGKIIGKNLRGRQLENKLAEIFEN